MLQIILLAVALATTPPGPGPSAGPGPGPNAGPGPGAALQPDAPAREALFLELVQAVRSYHVFAPRTEANLGRTWADELPALQQEFARADTAEALGAALHHFQNSLRNRHCSYSPAQRPRLLTVGFVAEVEWVAGKPSFYVAELTDPGLAAQLARGDEIVAHDGVPADRFLARFSLESNANNLRAIAGDVALFLGRRRSGTTTTREGDTASFTVRSRATGRRRTVRLTWTAQPDPSTAAASATTTYPGQRCASLPDRNYGPYTLHDTGVNFCLYTAAVAPFDAYPVVRHFSFVYALGEVDLAHLLRLEQHLLATQLAALPGARGVVLDLRDNQGGNNPNWFFDWWAPGPYVDRFVDVRLHEDFSSRRRLEQANVTGWRPRDLDRYLQALGARQPGQQYLTRRPFFCRNAGCDGDNRYTPAHPVTALPVALLVGPRCTSACDSFALTFHENRFGPLVGEPAAAAYTAYRLEYPVRAPGSGANLGVLRLAFSREVSGKTGEEIEGRLLPLDVPVERTFANRTRYDELLVRGAIEGLAAWPAPGPAADGPGR